MKKGEQQQSSRLPSGLVNIVAAGGSALCWYGLRSGLPRSLHAVSYHNYLSFKTGYIDELPRVRMVLREYLAAEVAWDV